ncbi:MAG: hypothetical protein GPJ52_14105 [Candidatus Heimdallarchaeota archaeon]|nr:hypothetical protein [Candidatus Heimdallarchaeota archaeon]
MNDTLVYLYDNDVIDIMNTSNLKDIKKERSINLDTYMSINEFSEDVFYDCENNSIYNYDYDYYDRFLNVTAFHYNNTHVTEIKTSYCNISANYTIFRYYQFYQSENTLYLIMYNRSSSNFLNDDIYMQVNLLTFDITNKTQPELLAPPISLLNITNYEEWGEPDRYIITRDMFSFYDNNLYLVRAYLSHEVTDGDYHYDDLVYSYGYIKAWDLSNYTNPEELFTIEMDQWDYSVVIISDNFMFYKSSSGFQLYNISDYNNIQHLSDYFADDDPTQIIFSDNLYYLICYRSIHILDMTDPTNIKKIGQYKVIFQGNGWFHKGILKEKVLYLLRSSEYEDRSFFVIDCTNSKNPKKLFPSGGRLSRETLLNLAIYSMFIGSPVGAIIIIVATVLLVRRRRKKRINTKKIEVNQD